MEASTKNQAATTLSPETKFPDETPAHEPSCDLCALPLGSSRTLLKKGEKEYFFCCPGCRHVFDVLWESGIRGEGESLRESELFRRCREMGIIPGQGDKESRTYAENIPPEEIAETTIRVAPFWCGSCCFLVETALSRMKGVLEARASFASDAVTVRYLPRYLSRADMEQCLAGIGYPPVKTEPGRGENLSRSLLFRLGISAFLTANVMMLTFTLYSGFFSTFSHETHQLLAYPSLVLTLVVIIYCGYPIFQKALAGLRQGIVSMETLIVTGATTAVGLGIYGTYIGGLHLYFETACMLITLVLVGKFIEAHIKERVMADAHQLGDMAPRKARLVIGAETRLVAIEAVRAGDECLIEAGEKVPLDGVVVEGEGLVDESMITGESRPVSRGMGDELTGATVLLDGLIRERVQCEGGESTVDRMASLVKEALLRKGPMELPADRIARIFVPGIMAMALAAAGWLLFNGFPVDKALLRGLTIVVIACPCTLAIAIPMAKAAAVALAGRGGIVVKDPAALEAVPALGVIMFDKTGTLTEGRFSVREVSATDSDSARALGMVAAVEQDSRHYLARAVIKKARDVGAPIPEAEGVESVPGKGVRGLVNGDEVLVGSRAFLVEQGLDAEGELTSVAAGLESQGQTVVYFGWAHKIRGFIGMGDAERAESARTVACARSMGMTVWLVSGDSEATTAAVAERLGVDHHRGGLLPEEKAAIIKGCQSRGQKVAMVGDGINDAPALAAADLGIAIAVGKNIGLDASHVSIMSDSPARVMDVLEIGRIAHRIIRQNLFFSFAYNACAIPLAVAGMVNPLTAVTAMLLSSLTVVLNSYRISKIKLSSTADELLHETRAEQWASRAG